MPINHNIVKVEFPKRVKKFIGLPLGYPKEPMMRPDTHLYLSVQQPDGSRELHRVMKGNPINLTQLRDNARFYYVGLDIYGFAPTFSRVITDKQGHEWDCRMIGQLSVSDSRSILTSFAVNLVGPNSPITPGMVESWIANRISSQVRDAVREYTIDDLRDRQALPASWWEKRVNDWLAEYGLTVHINKVSWTSAQAEIAEAEAARQRDLDRVMQAKQREYEMELRETVARVDYEKRKKQIESNLKLSSQEREHQQQLLEKHHRKEMIEADTEIENARREAEKIALEHEVTLARLRQDAGAIKQAEKRNRNAEERYQAVVNELDELKSTLTRLADLPENLLARLADQNTRKANAAAERIVSPEFGISASALTGLGFRTDRQTFIEGLRERAAAGKKVLVHKTELITRDIGTAKVKGLPINTSLQIEFTSQRSGYITLLNIGTSGSIFIHVPNAYITPEQAKVESKHPYAIPGPELLPWDRLRYLGLDYIEIGPPGWEHIAVLVSDKPLISTNILAKTNPDSPFIKLGDTDFIDLYDALYNNQRSDTWYAGVLSFLVG